MKLHIKRDQSKGMLGGTSFEYFVKIDLSQAELASVQKYKADREVIFVKEVAVLGQKMEFKITIADLINGKSFKSKNLYELLTLEDTLKATCASLKEATVALAKIGTEEVFEF